MHPQSWQLLSSFCRFNLQRCWLPHSADGITSHLLWAWHWKLLPNSVQQWVLSMCWSFDRSAHHWFHFPWKWWEHQLCHQWVCNSISKACLFTPRLASYSLQFFNFALKKWGGGISSLLCYEWSSLFKFFPYSHPWTPRYHNGTWTWWVILIV